MARGRLTTLRRACNDWKAAAKCGSNTAAIDSINCDAYKNTACDISEYFTCLQGVYVCVGGMYDTAKLSMISTCAAKALCK